MGLLGFLFRVLFEFYSITVGAFAIVLLIYEVGNLIYKLYHIWYMWNRKDEYITKGRMWLSDFFAPPQGYERANQYENSEVIYDPNEEGDEIAITVSEASLGGDM